MDFLFLTLILASNPYMVAEPNPYAVADPLVPKSAPVRDGFYLHYGQSWSWPESGGNYAGEVALVGPWHNGRSVTYATLQSPTVEQIATALEAARRTWQAERQVSQTASPKGWPPANASGDSNLEGRGPWPDGLSFDESMKRYKRASVTQEIAVTNGSDRITPVHRLDLHARDDRWLVSGGLLGIDGFRSDLYRNDIAANSREYVGNISVLNSLGYYQNNRGWRREFADGSKFMDVLSAAGKVFEIRQREKSGGKWSSEVVYEDETARPMGYTGLNRSCVSCHNAKDGAGTGPYAGPLVNGSDTVLSYPFRGLER